MDGPKGPNVHVLTAPDLGLPDVVNAFFPLAQALGWTVFQSAGTSYLVYFGRDDAAEIADLTAIAEAEAEIARRGLLEEYADVLACNLGAYVLPVSHQPPSIDYAALGALITAPPEARVRAMLEVLKGE